MISHYKEDLVSIALATFNGERFLHQQLDSLLSQTYSNFEIVVSDDNSKDSTQQILEEYKKNDSRVTWSVNPSPSGFIKNFERAISLCRGEIIFLCDQDDIWYENKIAAHVDAYKDSSAQWVYNEVRLVNERGTDIGRLTDSIPEYYKKRPLLYSTWGSCILGCSTSYRSHLLHGIWPADRYAPGHDSWIQLAIFPAKSFHIPAILQDYRQHPQNVFGIRESSQNEHDAIVGNMLYLKNLVKNDRLQAWKRFFLFSIIIAKYMRAYATNAGYIF